MSRITITGGIFKGRNISHSGSDLVRPTSSRVRQGVFSICYSRQIEGNFLDLFAGSGLMSFEALSRGFQKAVCVEQNRQQCGYIKENISAFNLEDSIFLIQSPVSKAFDKIKHTGIKFSAVYVDPPYNVENLSEILDILVHSEVVERDGLIFMEKSARSGEPACTDGAVVSAHHRWGTSEVIIYELR